MQVIEVPQTLFLIFTIAVVLSLVVQAGVFLGLLFVAKTAASKAEKIASDVSSRTLPILSQTRALLEDLSPKIRTISANLAEVSATVKDQTRHVNSTVGEVVDKTRTQAERVDEMVSAVLDGLTHATATIQHGVAKPVRQVSGVLAGLRVGFESLLSQQKRPAGAAYQPSASKPFVVSDEPGAPTASARANVENF